MDKNTVIGLILIVLTIIGFSYYNAPNYDASQTEANNTESTQKKEVAKTTSAKETKAVEETVAEDTAALFFAAKSAKGEEVTLENKKVSIVFNTKGATVSQVRLPGFKSYQNYSEGKEVPLLLYDAKSGDASMYFMLETKTSNLNLSEYVFQLTEKTDTSVTFELSQDNKRIVYTYSLLPDNYLLNFSVQTEGFKDEVSTKTNTLQFCWQDKIRQQEKGYYFENMYSALTYKVNGEGTEKLNDQEDDEVSVTESVDWIAFKNQYFSCLLIAKDNFKNVNLKSQKQAEGSGYLKDYTAEAEVTFDPSGQKTSEFQFYFGPNNYRLLQSMDEYKITNDDQDLEDLVYLGWPLFKWINRYFTIYVFDWFTQLGLPMGVVLLLITLLLRAIVYVPSKKSYLSSAKMRVLKPKIDEIAKKYPKQEDAMKRQQETMSLYSQYGVSPMGGCLPMLVQMPIWIAMFNFVPNAIELRQESFLFAEDLSTYDSLITFGTDLPLIGDHLSLFCLLFCGTNIVYSIIMMRQQRDTMSSEQAQQMKIMQWMMFLMPVFFFFMFNKYSAGLNYYYFISLLAGALTMWYMRKTTDDAKLLAKLEANYQANKQNPQKRGGGLAARLAALQEQQVEAQRKQEEARRNRKKKLD